MSVATVREAMATALRTITGLNASAYLTDQINPPHAMVDFGIDPYDLTFGGSSDEYQFTIEVFASRAAEYDGQAFLDGLRDPRNATSIPNVLEADTGLNALVQYSHVIRVSRCTAVTVQQADYLMISFDVEVVL